ncbi:hypothetical protein PsorP6_003167 [Peronosclerospora sorghi]|uniref:Uncharacterized protein n=1 Tax=Peronosclerospora sorghi TaxID=230839 RepID=A0ACC0VJ67_9STRA|nr:hypothetical protein PsorP6_003167 [Peronosclerospora sorghi]
MRGSIVICVGDDAMRFKSTIYSRERHVATGNYHGLSTWIDQLSRNLDGWDDDCLHVTQAKARGSVRARELLMEVLQPLTCSMMSVGTMDVMYFVLVRATLVFLTLLGLLGRYHDTHRLLVVAVETRHVLAKRRAVTKLDHVGQMKLGWYSHDALSLSSI